MNFDTLKNIDLEDLSIPIKPLRKGELASEYSARIIDYSKGKFADTDRVINPYNSTHTHGVNCYDRLLEYIHQNPPQGNIIDMGCGSGELLHFIGNTSNIENERLYGTTICIGEVKYARDIYKLENVIPGDMRNCDEIFDKTRFDIIIFHCVFQFITEEDRIETMIKASSILNDNGCILVVDYKDNPCAILPNSKLLNEYFTTEIVGDNDIKSMGLITKFKKNG